MPLPDGLTISESPLEGSRVRSRSVHASGRYVRFDLRPSGTVLIVAAGARVPGR